MNAMTHMEKRYEMKNFIFTALVALMVFGCLSCTDIQGDGIDTVIWEGSQLPNETSFRNPVWEPDLGRPSVFRGATQFYAFGQEKEWSEGLNYVVPVLRSSDLMSWNFNGEAFASAPDWGEGRITSVGVEFSKTLGTYYLFYSLGDAGIGVAYSKAPQGPYVDYGKLFDADSLGYQYVREPFFIQSGLDFYLFFETDQGVYGIELDIKRNMKPLPNGNAFRIAGSDYTGIFIFRMSGNDFYCFGTVGNEVTSEVYMGRASGIEGPYLDKEGNDLVNNAGTLLIREGDDLKSPGHVGGVFTDRDGKNWIMFGATDINKPELNSGDDRRPLILHQIDWDENGWPAVVIEANSGWTAPRFVLN